MSRKVIISLCAVLSVFAFGTMTVGQASGANMRIAKEKVGFLAIYGFPAANNAAERPVGGGIGFNFGFGQNMLFQAGGGKGRPVRFSLTLKGGATATWESCDAFLGGTLMSNNTGRENPLSFGIEFADFQCFKATGLKTGKLELTPAYADTQDQKWIAEICGLSERKCRVDPLKNMEEAGNEGNLQITHVAISVGPGLTVQGIVWGKWKNGAPPCIQLQSKPANATESQNLIVTQTPEPVEIPLGTQIKTIEGEFCLASANNGWYQQSEKTEPFIEISE